MAALVVAMVGTALAAGEIAGSDQPETVLRMRVTKDGKTIGNHNDGTVKKAGVGIYDITFNTGPTGSKVPLDLTDCAIFATPRVETASKPEEVAADVDVQRLGGPADLRRVDAAAAVRRQQAHAVPDQRELRPGGDLLRLLR
jgi:hypothetical protein